MRFKKKPVVIEAFQHFSNTGTTAEIPIWGIEAISKGTIYEEGKETFIKTLEGEMHVSEGDWIIKGVNGELYPCKPEIFEKTYEKVD